jgi:hypothetical protein
MQNISLAIGILITYAIATTLLTLGYNVLFADAPLSAFVAIAITAIGNAIIFLFVYFILTQKITPR